MQAKCIGTFNPRSLMAVSALCSSKHRAISLWWLRHAMWRGVRFSLSCLSELEPISISMLATRALPLWTLRWRGVLPSVVAVLRSTSWMIKSRTACKAERESRWGQDNCKVGGEHGRSDAPLDPRYPPWWRLGAIAALGTFKQHSGDEYSGSMRAKFRQLMGGTFS